MSGTMQAIMPHDHATAVAVLSVKDASTYLARPNDALVAVFTQDEREAAIEMTRSR
jgi:hypothetical protein